MEKPRLTPGPDHPITVTPNPRRVTVSVGGRVIAGHLAFYPDEVEITEH